MRAVHAFPQPRLPAPARVRASWPRFSRWLDAAAFRTNLSQLGDLSPHPDVARAHKMEVQGIDVSRWQGDIDWARVGRSGKRFAFIKATEGQDHSDPMFLKNWNEAKRAGVARGAYHFMYWCSSAEAQARWFIANVPRDDAALPPVIDAEWNSHSRTCAARIDPDLARAKIAYMMAALEAHYGQRPIIYTDIPFHEDVLENRLPETDFWIRSTAAEPAKRYRNRADWRFWQFTTTGRVPGITRERRSQRLRRSPRQWERWLKGRAGARRTRILATAQAERQPTPARQPTQAFSEATILPPVMSPDIPARAPGPAPQPTSGLGDPALYPAAGQVSTLESRARAWGDERALRGDDLSQSCQIGTRVALTFKVYPA